MKNKFEAILKQPVFAVDTETTGLDWKTCKVGLISVSDGDMSAAERLENVDIKAFLAAMKDRKKLKVFKNAKFDIHMLMSTIGMKEINSIADVEFMAKLYTENLHSYRLKDLAELYIDKDAKKTMNMLQGYMQTHNISLFTDVPDNVLKPYAIADAYYTMRLYRFYAGTVSEHFAKAFKMEMDLLPVVIAMERRGVLIDVKFLEKQGVALKALAAKLYKTLHKYFGDINFRSTAQVADVLVNKYNVIVPKTDKGNYSLKKEVLELLDHPAAKTLVQHRQALHVEATYCSGMRQQATKDNLLHCSFNQMEAVTGRFSCSEPNLQNIPREIGAIRRAFICRPGYINYSFDYSQIEMRILADYCKDPSLVKMFANNIDSHTGTAAMMLGKPVEKITDEERRHYGKTINFAVVYGMGIKGLMLKYGKTYEEAKRFFRDYYAVFPAVRNFQKQVADLVAQRGWVKTIIGRRRRLPKELSYVGLNAIVQGSAADIMKLSMIRLGKLLEKQQAYMLIQVHDELIIEFKKSCHTVLLPQVKAVMEDFKEYFDIPIKVDVKEIKANWQDAKEL